MKTLHLLAAVVTLALAGFCSLSLSLMAQSTNLPPTLVAAEYFFDTDLGPGKCTLLTNITGSPPVQGPSNTFFFTRAELKTDIAIPSSLSSGVHSVGFRFRGSTGTWGLAQTNWITVTNALWIHSAEYYFDTDPGAGKGLKTSLSSGGQGFDHVLQSVSFTNLDTSSLSVGIHQVYVRVQDNDLRWGPSYSYAIQVVDPPRVAGLQYYAGDFGDPATNDVPWQPMTPINGDPVQGATAVIDTSTLARGVYPLQVRAVDNYGVAGQPATTNFAVLNSPPVFTPVRDQLLTLGQPLNLPISVVDPDGTNQTLSFTVGSPLGAQLDPVTRRLTWTPTADPSTTPFTIYVTDGTTTNALDVLTFNLFVESPTEGGPPVLLSAAGLAGSTTVTLQFNRPLGAVAPSDFAVNGLAPSAATLLPDGRTVALTVPLLPGPTFTLTVQGVNDTLGRTMSTNATGLVLPDFQATDLGDSQDPVEPGQVYALNTTNFWVSAGGSSIAGTDDHGHFLSEPVEGDFDVRVAVAQLDPLEFETSAGLMARGPGPDAAAVGVYLRPGGTGLDDSRPWHVVVSARGQAGAPVSFLRDIPASSWPGSTWLRLQRNGNTFRTYTASDGTTWTQLTSTNLSLPPQLSLGLATSAGRNLTRSRAWARYEGYGGYTPWAVSNRQDQISVVGGAVSFTVKGEGVPPLSYQWYSLAGLLPNQTNATLTLANLVATNQGAYWATVSNPLGTATSVVSKLTLNGLGDPGYEGDVYPTPTNDNRVTTADWVRVGRMAAGLESPLPGSEFQRADCAPRVEGGDGVLDIRDWVQAGRYLLRLDPPTPAAGPKVPRRDARLRGERVALQSLSPPDRVLELVSAPGQPGQEVAVPVVLRGSGVENAAGFSLEFDPTQLRFARIETGTNTGAATMLVNPAGASAGQVGIALALPVGAVWPTGRLEVARVVFVPLAGELNAAVRLGDDPVAREVVDSTAEVVSAAYRDGVVWLGGPIRLGGLEPTTQGVWRLTFDSPVDDTVTVETSTDLAHWTPAAVAARGPGWVELAPAAPGNGSRFYRCVRY